VATAASKAFPPRRIISMPDLLASTCADTTAPLDAITFLVGVYSNALKGSDVFFEVDLQAQMVSSKQETIEINFIVSALLPER
jgi:hypothetical protein